MRNRNFKLIVFGLLIGFLFFGCSSRKSIPQSSSDGLSQIENANQWKWDAWNDRYVGGTSSARIIQSMDSGINKINVSGNVNFISNQAHGYSGWSAMPDEINLTALRNGKSFSFKCKGDGKQYLVLVATSDVTDYCYYRYTFTASDSENTILVLYENLEQPSWGNQVTFNKNNITHIDFQIRAEMNHGPFNITIWNIKP
jgi:hypothetical protein